MPQIDLFAATGFRWQICTRAVETTLRAWFDEVLPWALIKGRPVDDFDVLYPKIMVHPMWAWKYGTPTDPDWLCDTRVIGRAHDFPAADGETGLKALLELRRNLERELRELSDRRG